MDSEIFKAGRAAASVLSPDGHVYPAAIRKRLNAALRALMMRAGKENEGWLHDNYYMIFREGRADLSFLRQKIPYRASGGEPILMGLCEAYVRAVKGEVTAENAEEYWRGVLSGLDLEEKELSALRAFLGAAMIFSFAQCDAETAEKLIKSIRIVSEESFSELFEELSPVAKAFKRDTVYKDMNKATRAYYRKRVESMAKKAKKSEKELAEELILRAQQESRHVGELLFPSYGKDTVSPLLYGGVLYIITTFCAAIIWRAGRPLLAFVAWPVIYEIVKLLFDRFLLLLCNKPPVFAMAFREGIPAEEATLAVITSMAKNPKELLEHFDTLEEHYLAERGSENLIFGLLIDIPEAAELNRKCLETMEKVMAENCCRLEKRYGQPFAAFLREPVFHEEERKYAGRERKRGALMDLIAWLARGEEAPFFAVFCPQTRAVRHLVTLDRDTKPYPGSITALVAAAAHVMNRPVILGNRVKEGFGILEPSLLLSPKSLEQHRFARLFGGIGGNDVYSPAARDFYTVVFGRTPFGGKGLIDVAAADKLLPDAFPEGMILSHDTPEGGILRAGMVGEAVFFEDFPDSPMAYYNRLDRWTRGDAQNIRLLFRADSFTGFLILDNIRRAVLPLFLLLTITISMYTREYICELLALAVIFRPFLAEVWRLARYGGDYAARYLTLGDSDHGRAFSASLYRLILLPYECYVCLRALLVGWVRCFITKRKLLEWSVSRSSQERLRDYAKAVLWPSLLASVLFPYFTVLWLPAFLFMWKLGEGKKKTFFTDEEKHYIRETCQASMGFFREVCKPAWGYLPADSLQIYPATGIGPRTSPTDIGMFLLSAVSYADMGLDGAEQMIEMACRALDAAATLPGEWGHLYNWYDLNTMQPALPKVLSSVDSGNLRASLYVFSEAMRERGREEHALRARKFADGMSFGPFYKKDKKLLAVAYDAEKQELTENDYDLYESEARIASFLAVAHGEVPAEHWKKLGRAVKTWKGAAGAASWGGTMFEYLTPYLFMQAPPGTLARESEAFAVMAEKVSGRRKRLPWGISESAFYAFDESLQYRYKAHGVSELATAPSRTGEYVLSPYAAFLAVENEGSVDNLKRIEALGGRGKFGFFEAVDASDPQCIRPVECYMPHHIGMQAAAAANALCDGIHRKRFMRIREHKAAERLLWEAARHTPVADAVSGEAPPATLGNATGARLITDPKKHWHEQAAFSLGGQSMTINAIGMTEEAQNQMTLVLTHRGKSVSLMPQKTRPGRRYETILAKDKALFAYRETDFVSEVRLTAGNDPRLCLTLTSHAPQVENFHIAAARGGDEWMQLDFTLMPGEQKSIERRIEG